MNQRKPRSVQRILAILLATCLAFVLSPATSSSAVNGTAKKACCGNKITFIKEVDTEESTGFPEATVGQVRVSNGELRNLKGNKIGKKIGEFTSNHTIVAINVDNGYGGKVRKVHNVVHLKLYKNGKTKKGTMILHGVTEWPICQPPSRDSCDPTQYSAITGGTGAYAGVTGTSLSGLWGADSYGDSATKGQYLTTLKFTNK